MSVGLAIPNVISLSTLSHIFWIDSEFITRNSAKSETLGGRRSKVLGEGGVEVLYTKIYTVPHEHVQNYNNRKRHEYNVTTLSFWWRKSWCPCESPRIWLLIQPMQYCTNCRIEKFRWDTVNLRHELLSLDWLNSRATIPVVRAIHLTASTFASLQIGN